MTNHRRGIAALALLLGQLFLPGSLSARNTASSDYDRLEGPSAQVGSSADTVLISLVEAQRLALSQNPAFQADRQGYDIALGQLRQARVYTFNPELEFQAPGAGTGGALGEYEARLSQEVEWAGQRGLRIRAADQGVAQADATVRNAARQVLADVTTAFYAALAAEERLGVARQLLQLNQQLIDATRIQAREGEISSMEANLAEIEAGRARARVLASQREATSARLELQHLTGITPEQEIQLVTDVPEAPTPDTLDLDSLLTVAFARRPDLEARSRAVQRFETLTRLSRREAIPNVRLGLFAEREAVRTATAGGGGTPGFGNAYESPRIGVGVSLPVPLFDRNQGIIAERTAMAEQSRLNRAATELAVRTEVADAHRSYVAASEEARVFELEVLQPVRINQELLETAYRAGKVNLPTLLLLRNQLLDAELGYWDAWLARRRALVALHAATATLDVETNPNPPRER